MAESTAIDWTDATWNPWWGCEKVSPGCAHCYAERLMVSRGHEFKVKRTSDATFRFPLKVKEPKLIFTCSMSDFFIEEADPWRPEVWDIIRRTPHLTYQILTKRPERIRQSLPPDWGRLGWPNVWLGVSVENNRHRWRVDVLKSTPAAVRFVSAEPLLSPIDFEAFGFMGVIDWLIAGGESGPGFRPMDLDWARSLRDQCERSGVPFFLKQLGGWPDQRTHERAILDGRTHTEMPPATATGQLAMALP